MPDFPDGGPRGPIDPRQPLPPELDPRGRRAARVAARQRDRRAAETADVTLRGGAPIRRSTGRRPRDVRIGVLIGTRFVAAGLSLAVLIGSFWAWSTWRKFTADIPHGAAVAPLASGKKDIDGTAQNILLLGNDSRAGATPAELKALGTQNDGGSANTDTMMLMHLPANGSKASVISFPRDSYVAIPGYGSNKLNAAYPDGYNAAKAKGATELDAESAGIAVLSATLSQLTGLHIDHYMMINLLGFYRISNAIGGVPVLMCTAVKESNSGINLPAGLTKNLEGSQALAFVRQRYGFANGLGDLDRIKRQQYFLTQVFHTVTKAGTLLDPFKIQDLLNAVSSSLITDPSIDILGLANDFQQMSSGNLTFQTVPTDGFADNSAGSVVVVHPAAVQAFVQNLIDPVATPTPTTVAPSTVTVDVLNGSSENGAASRAGDALKAHGFVIDQVGTAPTQLATTTVEYPAGSADQAATVAQYVPGAKIAASSTVQRVTLVLGTDGAAVGTATPTAAAAPTTSTAPAATTAAAATGLVGVPNQPGCVN